MFIVPSSCLLYSIMVIHELLSAPWVTNYNYNNRKRIRMDKASESFEFPASVFSGPPKNEEFLSTCLPMF